MKKATILFIGLLTAVSVFSGCFETPEDLAEQFIANINAKDQKGQWELLHPRCVKELSSLGKEFIDVSSARDFRKTIPKKRNIKVTKWLSKMVPYGKIADWPVKLTHQFEVEFSTGEGLTSSSTRISRFIAKEDGRWFITVPIINEEYLRKNADKKSELYLVGAYANSQPGILENRTDYGEMLAHELGINHVNVRMRYDQPVYIAVHYSEKMEGKTIRSRTVTLKKPAKIVGIYFVHRTLPWHPRSEKTITHKFDVKLTSYTKEEYGDRERQREYLQERPKYESGSSIGKYSNSLVFDGTSPLPLNCKTFYYSLTERKGNDGKEKTYWIHFEVSEKPIQEE